MALGVVLILLAAQTVATRSGASDYPAHSRLSGVEIGARYLPRGVPGAKTAGGGEKYLAVEVAIFPTGSVPVSKRQFSLHVNGESAGLFPQSPVSSLEARSNSSQDKDSIVLGGPPLPSRYPRDDGDQSRMPRRPVEVEPSKQSGVSSVLAALPEGPATKPVKGYLLFRFDGDAKSIRSLQLVYDAGGPQKARLRLL